MGNNFAAFFSSLSPQVGGTTGGSLELFFCSQGVLSLGFFPGWLLKNSEKIPKSFHGFYNSLPVTTGNVVNDDNFNDSDFDDLSEED